MSRNVETSAQNSSSWIDIIDPLRSTYTTGGFPNTKSPTDTIVYGNCTLLPTPEWPPYMPHIKHPRRTFLISPFAVVRYLHHGTRHPRTWSRPTLNPQIVRFTNDEIRFAPQEALCRFVSLHPRSHLFHTVPCSAGLNRNAIPYCILEKPADVYCCRSSFRGAGEEGPISVSDML